MDEEDKQFIKDFHKMAKLENQKESRSRRFEASYTFEQAQHLANEHGLVFKQMSDTHYQLRKPYGWILNLYPGNQRLYWDRNFPNYHININKTLWTLLDVVEAIVAQGIHLKEKK